MDGLAKVRLSPHISSGNITGDIFEQINRGLVKVRDNLGRRIGFFSFVRASNQVRRDNQAQRFRANSRAIGDDEIAEREQRFILLPHGDVQEGVGANDERKPVAVVNVAEIAHGVHGIVKLCAAEVLAGFGKRRNEVRMLGASERDHRKTVRKRSEVLLQLVRRTASGNEMNFVEIKTPVGGASDRKVAIVDGVEGAAKNRDTSRMMLCGGAVRLRYGQ